MSGFQLPSLDSIHGFDIHEDLKTMADLISDKHGIDVRDKSRVTKKIKARHEFVHWALSEGFKAIKIARFLNVDHSTIHHYQNTPPIDF